MKKNLALILALVMIIGSLFSVVPMAEGASSDSGKYVPEIAYANVNFKDNIHMMFAVAAPAELAEGEEIKLLVWPSRDDSISFSYFDTVKEVIDAEAEKVTINGSEYLVFNYAGLGATEMTNIICARAVLVKDGVATSYGKLIDYSVLEYTESVKGNLDGIDGIEDEGVIEALDAMLNFGSLAQQFSGNEYDFLADDELHTIYVTTVLNGADKGRSFAGFFKYEDGVRLTLRAPFYDGTSVIKVSDSEGNVIEDADAFFDGFQLYPEDKDLELVVEYRNAVARSNNPDPLGAGMEVNNYDSEVVGGNGLVTKATHLSMTFKGYGSANLSGAACVLDSANRMNYWNSIKTVADPTNPDNVVFQLTATNSPALNLTQITAADFAGVGFGDTIYPAFTFEMTLGATGGKMPTTGYYYFRHRLSALGQSMADLRIFRIMKGEVQIADGTPVGMIPENGMRRFAISVDALTGEAYGYAENLETGEMEFIAKGKLAEHVNYTNRKNAYEADPVANANLAMYANVYAFFTQSAKLEPIWEFGAGAKTNAEFEASSIEIDGVMTTVKNDDGTFNMDAVKALAERDYSFLLDDFNLVMGFTYDR